MLRPSKTEIETISALLAEGDESPDALAYRVIQLVEQLRYEREVWVQVFELSPGIYAGYGPYATRHMAEKAAPKQPMAQIAVRGAFVPLLGPNRAEVARARADAPLPSRGDFALIREDAALFRKGWSGRLIERAGHVDA